MARVVSDLAYRTAVTAGPFVESLAEDVVSVAQELRHGELADALAAFATTAERLHRFLTYLVVVSELLIDSQPTLGAILAEYSRRLLAAAESIEALLTAQDFVGVVEALENSLARTLSEYTIYAQDVRRALVPRPEPLRRTG